MINSFERFIEAAESYGLNVRITEAGKRARMNTPGHSDLDDGMSIAYNGKQVGVHFFNEEEYNDKESKEAVLAEIGLAWTDLYDNPRGDKYGYSDGRTVTRTPNKVFRQICKHNQAPSKCAECKDKLTVLYGQEFITESSLVYVVEGEKDVDTARNNCGVVAVSQNGGSSNNPNKADWSPLAGHDVIIVQDKDKPGEKRAKKVHDFLLALDPPAKPIIVEALLGNDLTDHVSAGKTIQELVPVSNEPEQEQLRRKITLIPASSVKTERLEWLVDNWIPRRSMTLLAGREGLGKSTIACDFAAQATKGQLNAPPMNVVYLNTEDSRSITVKPRLQAAGADLDRVFFFDVTTEAGLSGSLQLPGDTPLLEEVLVSNNVGLVVLDAAKSAMHSSLDGYRDDDVRQFLEPLAAMCDKHDIAILGLVHFGKRESNDSGKLILGSVAWSQIARSVLSVAKKKGGPLVVTNTKGNLAASEVSREVQLVSTPITTDDDQLTEVGRVAWGEFTTESAADLLGSSERESEEEERTEAEAWLEDYLTHNGETPRADVFKAAAKDHIASERTIKRAFKNLNGVSTSSGFPRVAKWSLPMPSNTFDSDPRAKNGGPTGPTGADQDKRNGPTGEKTQLGHAHVHGPTGDPNGDPTDVDPNQDSLFEVPKKDAA